MTDRAKMVQANFHTVTPYMIFEDANRAIEFYQQAFGATELTRVIDPATGKIRHAEIKIGDSPIMLVDGSPKFPQMRSATSLGASPIQLYLYVDDVDALAERAVAAGALTIMPLANSDDGERRGGLQDPFGYTWWIATPLSPSQESQEK